MVNLNCILATCLEWGQKAPPNSESSSGIEDISCLAEMAQLEVLILGETKKIYDYSCLGKLKNLKVFGVCQYQTNISGIKLKMKSNRFINEMPNLQWVDLVDCKIG